MVLDEIFRGLGARLPHRRRTDHEPKYRGYAECDREGKCRDCISSFRITRTLFLQLIRLRHWLRIRRSLLFQPRQYRRVLQQSSTLCQMQMPAANEEAMLEAIQNVKTGQVTYAVRDTKIDDKEIHEGDIMGIGDAGIIAVGTDIQNTAKEMLAAMVDEDSELISLYYGEEISAEDAESFAAEIAELYPDMDIDAQFGGQPIYYYVMAVE